MLSSSSRELLLLLLEGIKGISSSGWTSAGFRHWDDGKLICRAFQGCSTFHLFFLWRSYSCFQVHVTGSVATVPPLWGSLNLNCGSFVSQKCLGPYKDSASQPSFRISRLPLGKVARTLSCLLYIFFQTVTWSFSPALLILLGLQFLHKNNNSCYSCYHHCFVQLL